MTQAQTATPPANRPKTWITGREVSELLDVSIVSFRRNVQRLMDCEGFPLPSPHSLSPVMWRRVPVLAWIESQSYTQADVDAAPCDGKAGGTIHHLRLAQMRGAS